MKTKDPAVGIPHIVSWLKAQLESSKCKGFVIGISGGIDSALTSTLCAETNKQVVAVSMPILQHPEHLARAQEHQQWLLDRYLNVSTCEVDLSDQFRAFSELLKPEPNFTGNVDLALANTRSRLRMVALYAFANARGLLVAGTGNKVEDYGVGFFTKYGDGGVDCSPIADLTKTEVKEFAKHLQLPASIIAAKPSDGLWDDTRDDESQIGATYEELEWAMSYFDQMSLGKAIKILMGEGEEIEKLSSRQMKVLEIYFARHEANQHKLQPPPVCLVPASL